MEEQSYPIPYGWTHLSKDEIIQNLLSELQEKDEELNKLYEYLENLPVDLEDILG